MNVWKFESNDEEYDRVGPLQDALVTPGVRGQSQLQGENPGVEGGQVVPLLPAWHHLQDCPGEHLDQNSELFTEKVYTCQSIPGGDLGLCCYWHTS